MFTEEEYSGMEESKEYDSRGSIEDLVHGQTLKGVPTVKNFERMDPTTKRRFSNQSEIEEEEEMSDEDEDDEDEESDSFDENDDPDLGESGLTNTLQVAKQVKQPRASSARIPMKTRRPSKLTGN